MPEKSPFEMTHEDRSVLHASVAGILNASKTAGEGAKNAAKSLGTKAKSPMEMVTREEQRVLQKVKRVMDSSTEGISSLKLSTDDMSLLEGTFRKHAEILEREGKAATQAASATARKTVEKAKRVESSLVEPFREAFNKHAPHVNTGSNTASAFSNHMTSLYSSIKNLRERVEVEVRFRKR